MLKIYKISGSKIHFVSDWNYQISPDSEPTKPRIYTSIAMRHISNDSSYSVLSKQLPRIIEGSRELGLFRKHIMKDLYSTIFQEGSYSVSTRYFITEGV